MTSNSDPHSFARPELAHVIHTHLELNVNFNQKLLKGNAILTVEKKHSTAEIILDNYGLVITSVTNPVTGTPLQYHIGEQTVIGSSFTIQLPPMENQDYKPKCKIQIEYETSPTSPALYWLSSLQTADGIHPFLLSNNKLTYARTMFPCQDTPSVKFSYTAKISVPKYLTVIMSALLQKTSDGPLMSIYEFLQAKLIPSYAVIIAVGWLKRRQLSVRTNLFAENKFINESVDTFSSGGIERMLQIAERLCGSYFWDRYDICVLPPSIAHFEIECPCITFVSPSLLHGDHSCISVLARNVAQSWAGNLVTCTNFNHLWLNKSFSMFICRKIICEVLNYKEAKLFLDRVALNDLNNKITILNTTGSLKCLVPNLKSVSPNDAIKHVPYEVGCMLLDRLESILGGPTVFEPFLKSYFYKFAYQSIQTDDWREHLNTFFSEKKEMLKSINWNIWFYDNRIAPLPMPPVTSTWEAEALKLAETWARWDNSVHEMPSILSQKTDLIDIQKIILLNSLHSYHTYLTVTKMQSILKVYLFENQNYQIRFIWLLLCIKVRWQEKIPNAVKFAIQFCSPNYACPIFEYLFKWPEVRPILMELFIKKKDKMLPYTQNKITSILHLN